MDELLSLFQDWLDARLSLYHESSGDFGRSARMLYDEAAGRAERLGIDLGDVHMDDLHWDMREED